MNAETMGKLLFLGLLPHLQDEGEGIVLEEYLKAQMGVLDFNEKENHLEACLKCSFQSPTSQQILTNTGTCRLSDSEKIVKFIIY